MAHFMGDQAANGVELVVGVALGQRDLESVVDALNRCVAADAVGFVSQAKNVTFVFHDVEFVFDFADDFFQHVFNRQQTGHAAKFVDDDGQMVAVATEFTQQIVQALGFGHKHGRAQQGADVQLGCALQF